MHSILIIDGDHDSKAYLRENLRKEGYKVLYSDKAKSGLDKAREKSPDLIISELIFPDSDGFEVIKEIRSDGKLMNIPIIILSEKADDFDKVLALELGADDYIVKPTCFREIAARIKSQFKYTRDKYVYEDSPAQLVERYGDIVINLGENDVSINGEQIVFSSKEFHILYLLLKNRGKSIKKDYLIRNTWGNSAYVTPHILNVYLGNIKRKIRKSSKYDFNIHIIERNELKVEIKEKENIVV